MTTARTALAVASIAWAGLAVVAAAALPPSTALFWAGAPVALALVGG